MKKKDRTIEKHDIRDLKELTTKRTTLRAWRLTDKYDLFEYAVNELVGPNAGWKPHKDLAESESIIQMFIDQKTVYAIELKENNKVIGGIGLHERTPDESLSERNQREIGFVLNPAYWGRGIIPEAVNRLIKYGFEELDLDLIWCGHYEENLNSKRVSEKCGFKFKFVKDEVIELLDGKKVRTHYYCLTKEDYKAK